MSFFIASNPRRSRKTLGGLVHVCAYLALALVMSISAGCATASPKSTQDWPPRDFCSGTSAVKVAGDVVAPRLLRRVEPNYPIEARREGVVGMVVLEAVVTKDGRVESLRVVDSPDTRLSDAATHAIRQWRYQPATLHGEPLDVCLAVRLDFHK